MNMLGAPKYTVNRREGKEGAQPGRSPALRVPAASVASVVEVAAYHGGKGGGGASGSSDVFRGRGGPRIN
jgi:hypothetical protein